ncbi:LuxR family transcriptional regulator [Gordonia polyisoprenivorans]|nr:LuxR family transcriptional regulator [Gordonia polyisoprenivorans]
MWQPFPWYLTSIPHARPDTIVRHRLSIALGTLVGEHRVVAVSAPSGHGKTVAVADWARDTGLPVAWLSMPRTEADPAELLRGMISAISRLPELGDHPTLASLHKPTVTASIRPCEFADAIDTIGQRVVVVIDDAHRVADALADPGIADLIENGPDTLRFVLVGHSGGLTHALSRALLHGTCAMVDASHLTFTTEEVAGTCATSGTSLDPQKLWAATGGWPIAVHAALMGGGLTPTGPDTPSTLLTDYVAAEILAPLPAELVEFILDMTTTSRFDLSLALTLSGRADAATLVADCVVRGLFLSRVTDRRSTDGDPTTVYTWHSLFVEHCRLILQRTDPDRQRKRRISAAEHLRDSHPLHAAELSLLADDAERAVDILTDNWIGLVISSGVTATETTATALESQVDDPVRACRLTYIRACCRAIRGDAIGARRLFADAEALHELHPNPDTDLTRAVATLLYHDDHRLLVQAHTHIVSVLDDPAQDARIRPVFRAGCTFLVGWTAPRLRIDPARGVDLLRNAIEECRAAGLTAMATRAESSHTFALAFAGRFTEITRVIADSDGGDEWDYYDVGMNAFTRGWIDFWTGDLDAALHNFSRHDNSRSMDGYPPLARVYRLISASILRRGAEVDSASADLEWVTDEDLHGVPWPVYRRLAQARAAEFGNADDEVRRLAAEVESTSAVPVSRALFAGMLRRQGDLIQARRFTHGLDAPDLPAYVRVYAMLTDAVVAWQSGDRRAAHRLLDRSITLAAPEFIALPFLDNHDQPTTDLLAAHAPRVSEPGFLAEMLTRRHTLLRNDSESTRGLTTRELEVLEYLRTPMTVQEIAAALFISPNTLKTHCRSLYRKLGVDNRRDAVRVKGFLRP